MKALIYYRKSTDRDDKQANSLEHQLTNCRNTAKNLWFEVIEEIGESISAKEEFKRQGFNKMIELCKKKKVNCIIIDESKRLSRNNIDTSRVVDLMDKNFIKGIFATSRHYLSENSHDKFLLQLDLSISKMENEDRSKDTRNKMLTCVKNGKCMTKVPFGYKNITIRKWHKDVIVDEGKRELVKSVFEMRKNGRSLPDIAEIITNRYPEIGKMRVALVAKMLANKFYYGIMKFSWVEYPGKHEPIISKKLFDEVQHMGRGCYEIANKWREFLLKGFLRDPSRMRMVSYVQKERIYYTAQRSSEYTINISEELVFEKAWEYLRQYESWAVIQELNKKIILDVIKEQTDSVESRNEEITRQLSALEKRKSELLNMRLDGKIDDDVYTKKLNEITSLIFELEESRKNQAEYGEISELYEKMIELSKSLYQSYNSGDNHRRALILKNVGIELLVNDKKELTLAENELFSVVKNLWLFDGSATENRTPVDGMKIRCPNH